MKGVVWQMLVAFILVLIVYLYTFKFIQNFILAERQQQPVNMINHALLHNDNTDEFLFNFAFERSRGTDCALNKLPCVTDQQCRDNCVIANAASELACRNGFCNASNALASATPPPSDTTECDPALGLMRIFPAGGDFVVSQTCVSVYRDLVDDTGAVRPYICVGGQLQLNLDTQQFNVNACECPAETQKMSFRQGALARTIPVCLPALSAPLYDRVYNN